MTGTNSIANLKLQFVKKSGADTEVGISAGSQFTRPLGGWGDASRV